MSASNAAFAENELIQKKLNEYLFKLYNNLTD